MEDQANKTPQNSPDLQVFNKVDVQDINGFIGVLSTVPTHTPKTFWDSIKIALGSLFVYDYKNNKWLSGGSQYYIGSGTSPASTGTETIDCGFMPKLIKITAQANIAGTNSISHGSASTTSNERCITSWSTGSAYGTDSSSGYIVNLLNNSGNSVCVASISSITSTGFVINWENTTIQGAYQFEAYG